MIIGTRAQRYRDAGPVMPAPRHGREWQRWRLYTLACGHTYLTEDELSASDRIWCTAH